MSVSAASGKSMDVEASSDDSFTYVYRVAGLLMDHLTPYPYTFTYAGIVIRILQFIGFVLNPLYTYNFMFMKEMSFFTFLFSAPFFDRHYGPLNMVIYVAILAVCVFILAMGGIFFVVNCVKPAWEEHTYILKFIRFVIESIAGWFFVPMMHLCLGGLPCSSGSVRNFPDTKCGSPTHIACYVFSVIGIIGSVVLASIGCLEFNPDPHSHHVLARAHGYCDFFLLLTMTVALIFFHILLGAGHDTSYSIMMMVLAAVWLVMTIVIIPFYNLRVGSLFTGTYLTVLVTAFVNCLTAYNISFLSAGTPVLQCTIVFSVFPATFIVGYLLGPIRVNSDFCSKIHKLHFYGYTPEHVALFPFPRTSKTHNHTVAPPAMLAVHQDMRYEINVEEQDAAESEDENQLGEINKHRFEFFVPYINNAYVSTDSEVATRFLRDFKIKTGGVKKYTSSQLLYTLNMYFKALGYFKQSAYVIVSMGWFLLSYCNRQAAVLELVNHIHSRTNFNADYMVGYKFYRLEYIVKESLGYRGAIYILALQRAHLFHRQALGTMVRFWSGLQNGDTPIQLLMAADELARLRRTAFHEYHLALTTNKDDRNALTYLASFIEDLLHQKDIADDLRNAISEMELDKKNKALIATHSNQNISNDKTEIEFRAVEKACEKDQTIRLTRHGNERIVFFSLLYYAVFAALAFLAGVLAAFVTGEKIVHQDIAAIFDIYRVKSSGFSTMYKTESIAVYSIDNDCDNPDSNCVSDLKFVQILQDISSSEQEMRVRQNKVAFGSNNVGYTSKAFQFASAGLLPLRFYSIGNTIFEGLFTSQDRKLVNLYSKLTSILSSVSTPQVEWLVSPVASAYITTMVNCIQKSIPYNHYMQFITDGGLEVFLAAMEPYASAVKEDIKSKATYSYTILSILMVLVIAHIFMIVAAHYAINAWSTKNRIMLINLFRKVPKAAVEDLRAQHALTLSSFRVTGENVKRDDEFADEEEEEEEEEDKNSEKVKAKINAFRSALVTVLQAKPGKSCFKQVTNTAYGPKRTVRFCLTQYDLVEHPRTKLHEPGIQMKGSKSKIVEDFEKSLTEIEEEVKRERILEQQRRDTYTEHLVTSGYRYQWRRIKERIASWGNSDTTFSFVIGGIVAGLMLALGSSVVAFLVTSLNISNGALDFEKSAINELKLLYAYVAAFDKSDIDASIFCNFFYEQYLSEFVDYSIVNEGYMSLSNSLQTVYDSDILQLTPFSEMLYSAVLRPTLSNIIYVALAARAGLGLSAFNLGASPYINSFTWGEQEADPLYLAQTYPRAFNQPSQYVIPTLDSLSDIPSDFYNAVLPLHRRDRFFDDVNTIRSALSFSGEKVKETSLNNVNKRNEQTKVYLAISFSFCAIMLIGLTVGVVVSFVRRFGFLPQIYLCVSLISTLVCFILVIISYKKQDNGTVYITSIQTVLEDVSQFRTYFYRRLVEIEQYFHSSLPTYLKSILQYQPSNIEKYLDTALKQFPNMQSQIQAIKTNDELFWGIQQISMFLLYASSKKKADPSISVEDMYPRSPPFISSYNYKMEVNYATDHTKYQSDPYNDLMYSTPDVDLLNSADKLFDMARFAVFGLRGANYFFTPFQEVENFLNDVVSESVAQLKKTDDQTRLLNIVSTIFIGIAVLCLFLAVLVPLVRFMRSIAEGPNAELVREGMKVSDNTKVSTIVFIAIGLSLLVVVFYILCMVPLGGLSFTGLVAENSAQRLAAVHRSMAKSLYVNHSFASNSPSLGLSAIATMSPDVEQMTNARDFLYFSSSSSKSSLGRIKTFSDAQRSLLFDTEGATDSMDTVYRNWITTLNNIIAIVPQTTVSTADPNTQMKDIYSVADAQKDSISGLVAKLENSYTTLVAAMEQSDDMYSDDIAKGMQQTIAPAIAFYCLITFALLICAFVFVPSLAVQEKRSEEDIRPILGALPKPVIDSVPTLSLFADSGIIDESSEAVKESCVLSTTAMQFLESWSTLDESELETGYAELENNPNACILTTETGIIVAANSAALTMFKHDSLSGKEVGILMDQGAADLHGRMMAYYVENRDKRVDGPVTVDVQAYTKNMDSIHIIIVLAEAPIRSDRLYFFAEIYLHSRVSLNKQLAESQK